MFAHRMRWIMINVLCAWLLFTITEGAAVATEPQLQRPTDCAQNADWTVRGDQAAGWLGNAVATAGDVNGDGYADIIVGAYEYSICRS